MVFDYCAVRARLDWPGSFEDGVETVKALAKEGWRVAHCVGVLSQVVWTLEREVKRDG